MSESFHESDELKQLKRKWYQKLKESGFQDIEDTDSEEHYLKSWHSTYFLRNPTIVSESIQNYFEIASKFLWEYEDFQKDPKDIYPRYKSKLPSPYARDIWEMHIEGFPRRKIARLLSEKHKLTISGDSIQKILSSLIIIMKSYQWLKKETNEGDQQKRPYYLPFLRSQ